MWIKLNNIQFINKTSKDVVLEMTVKDYEDATIKRVGDEGLTIAAGSRVDGVFFIEMARKDIVKMKTTVDVQLILDGEVIDEISTNFVGPVAKRN